MSLSPKQVQEEIADAEAKIAALRQYVDALRLAYQVDAPKRRGRPPKAASTAASDATKSNGKPAKRNWSPAAKAASKARAKARWKAAKEAGFSKLADFAKSPAGKAWAKKNM